MDVFNVGQQKLRRTRQRHDAFKVKTYDGVKSRWDELSTAIVKFSGSDRIPLELSQFTEQISPRSQTDISNWVIVGC